jgi:hypothetical protein
VVNASARSPVARHGKGLPAARIGLVTVYRDPLPGPRLEVEGHALQCPRILQDLEVIPRRLDRPCLAGKDVPRNRRGACRVPCGPPFTPSDAATASGIAPSIGPGTGAECRQTPRQRRTVHPVVEPPSKRPGPAPLAVQGHVRVPKRQMSRRGRRAQRRSCRQPGRTRRRGATHRPSTGRRLDQAGSADSRGAPYAVTNER